MGIAGLILLLVATPALAADNTMTAAAKAINSLGVELLPRAATNLNHYEAITRADTLALALLQLWSAHAHPERPLQLDWIDR